MNDQFRVKLERQTWLEIGEYLKKSDTIIVPFGAVEQHGPSCPLGTDKLIAEHIATMLGAKKNVLVGPAIPVGDSLIHLNFLGTIALNPSTLLLVAKDYIKSLYGVGFRRFLVVNGHEDNRPPLLSAFSELGNELSGLKYDVCEFWDFEPFRDKMFQYFGDRYGGHADACDASIVMAIEESLVIKERLASEYPHVSYRISRDLVGDLYTRSGVINADQRLASVDIGRELLEVAIQCYSQKLAQLME